MQHPHPIPDPTINTRVYISKNKLYLSIKTPIRSDYAIASWCSKTKIWIANREDVMLLAADLNQNIIPADERKQK